MRGPSQKSKRQQGRGIGEGKDYKPYIKSREINSAGTCSNVTDWKTGRQMQLLSQIEYSIYMQQRWRDDVMDIRERFPLDMVYMSNILSMINHELKEQGHNVIAAICYEDKEPMTTDLLLTLENGHYEAISIVPNRNKLSQRDIEKIWLEKKYWNSKGIEFRLMDKTDINQTLVKNLRLITEYYDKTKVYDEISAIKHLIATKTLIIDLEKEILDFTKYRELLRKEGYELCLKLD
jgi:hypothetical protein